MKSILKLLINLSISFGFLLIFINTGCVSSELRISEFKFNYNNENYRVISAYCPNNPESCNQLISDRFVAVDLNQDRIIDKISIGDVTLSEAQEIYNYCLKLLANQNKLQQINKNYDSFIYSDDGYDYEVKSFYTQMGNQFNEFSITKRPILSDENISVFVDKGANGKIDEIIKGIISIEKAQLKYKSTIQKGLSLGKLYKLNDQIVVK